MVLFRGVTTWLMFDVSQVCKHMILIIYTHNGMSEVFVVLQISL
jgi:hypothetical protein